MKLNALRIPCTDMNAAEDFYANKLKLEKIFGSLQEGFDGFKIEYVNIIIEPEEKGEFESNRYLGFSVSVDDIDTFYKAMI